ncbi:hypothetical protein DFJ74DRAFT_357096 [Hyaloraphidium curvatum]|nr:hypothetical protein DFJ74DRAFT_357096 [Hyaloraphidium curvatum]
MDVDRAETSPAAPAVPSPPAFSPLAWLAIFPSPAAPRNPLARGLRPADPAAAAREADPMTRPRLYAHVGATARLLFRVLDYVFWVRVKLKVYEFAFTSLITIAASIAPLWAFGPDDTFSVVAKAVGTIATVFTMVGLFTMAHFTMPPPRSKLSWWEMWRPLVENKDAAVDFYPAAVVARYADLAQHGDEEHREPGAKNVSDAVLLLHVEGDPECSCPRVGCAGDLWRRMICSIFAVAAVQAVFSMLLFGVAMPFTSLVTLAESSWTTPWSCALLIVALLALVHSSSILVGFTMTGPTSPVLQLLRRLHVRAMRIALDGLLEGFRENLLSDDANGHDSRVSDSKSGSQPLYAVLHWNLEPRWSTVHYAQLFYVWYGLAQVGLLVVPTLLLAVSTRHWYPRPTTTSTPAPQSTGQCVPFWIFVSALRGAFLCFYGLFLIATSNSSINILSSMQSEAALHARGLLVSSSSLPRTPGRMAAEASLSRHADALDAFARAGDAARARVGGVAVTPGGLRTLLVTIATVLFAVWGVARGLGVRATLETVCPTA